MLFCCKLSWRPSSHKMLNYSTCKKCSKVPLFHVIPLSEIPLDHFWSPLITFDGLVMQFQCNDFPEKTHRARIADYPFNADIACYSFWKQSSEQIQLFSLETTNSFHIEQVFQLPAIALIQITATVVNPECVCPNDGSFHNAHIFLAYLEMTFVRIASKLPSRL